MRKIIQPIGISEIKIKHVRKGRKSKINKKAIIEEVRSMQFTKKEIANRHNINPNTLSAILREIGETRPMSARRTDKVKRIALTIRIEPEIKQRIDKTGVPPTEFINSLLKDYFFQNPQH